MGDVDRRRAGVRQARRLAGQMATPGLGPPRADGWLAALLTSGSPPEDRRRPWPFEVEVAGRRYAFFWSAQCRVCRALRDGPGVDSRPKYEDGPLVYSLTNSMYLGMAPAREIFLAIYKFTRHWEAADRPGPKSISRHTKHHVAAELAGRAMAAREGLRRLGQEGAEHADGLATGYSAMVALLEEARTGAITGALRARTASDVVRLTEAAAAVERDLVGRTSENEWVATVYRLGKAMENRIPPEMFDGVVEDFRQMMGRPAPVVEAMARGELRDPTATSVSGQEGGEDEDEDPVYGPHGEEPPSYSADEEGDEW